MNYTKKMGLEALNRSLLLMSYDNKKTLTENVDNILIEQNQTDVKKLIRDAIYSFGTDPDTLKKVFDQLKTKQDYIKLDNEIKKNPNNFSVGGTYKSILDILNGELERDNLDIAKYITGKLKGLGINMTYKVYQNNPKSLYPNSIRINLEGTQSKPENKKNQAKPLDPNQGPKVTEFTCKVPNDKNYAYTSKDNNWFALNLKNNKRFNLTLLTKQFPAYKKTIDVLVKTCPTQLQTSATTQTTDQSQTQQRNNEPVTQMSPLLVKQVESLVQNPNITLTKVEELAPNNVPLVKEFCKQLFDFIDEQDQAAGKATATPQQRDDLSQCLQQYNFGIGQGASRVKQRYGLTSSGGDKGIR
jgi:hypothetical protein